MKTIAPLYIIVVILSCNASTSEYAIEWSKKIKENIIKDASRKPDNIYFDSSRNELILLLEGKKLKAYSFKRTSAVTDTATSIFYSDNQNFELVRELCPVVDRIFEGIRYKGIPVGVVELR